MRDTFSVRVGKTFGSLPAGSWSLGDEKLHRRECNRDKNSPEQESELHKYNTNSTDDFGNELENDLQDLQFDDEYLVEEEEEQHCSFGESSESKANLIKTKPDDYDEEHWDIKNSIGLDLTLDYEDEEDEYDKLAVGMENFLGHPGNMSKYVNDDDEIDIDEVTNLLKGFTGDVDEYGIKSHLKRLNSDDDLVSSTRQKRVRFLNEKENEQSEDQWSVAVPDYIRNPSRYTHYAFDSSDDNDDKSNSQAYLNLQRQLQRLIKSDTLEGLAAKDVDSIGVSKPVTSVPRKKSTDASKMARMRPIAFDIDDCKMDEDELMIGTSSERAGVRRTCRRQFRKSTGSELDE